MADCGAVVLESRDFWGKIEISLDLLIWEMGTYCHSCDRKVTSAESPVSCDCDCGDGYCISCQIEKYNDGGVVEYSKIEAFDSKGKRLTNVYRKTIVKWCCEECNEPLKFEWIG